jgi:hypothetical protein
MKMDGAGAGWDELSYDSDEEASALDIFERNDMQLITE